MSAPFFDRLVEYYVEVGRVLRGQADASSIFPNASDIGTNREAVYAELLKQHVPSKCSVRLGGFLFSEDGTESKQMDVIVTTDTAARYDFHVKNGAGKSFSCVEGTLAVFSIKSYLDKTQLFEALLNIASIPPTGSLEGRVPPRFVITDYEDWPYKVIYASDGMTGETLSHHMDSFYRDHPEIHISRRPNLIHVAGKHATLRAKVGRGFALDTIENEVLPGQYGTFLGMPDVQALAWLFHDLQIAAEASTQVMFSRARILLGVSEAVARRHANERGEKA